MKEGDYSKPRMYMMVIDTYGTNKALDIYTGLERNAVRKEDYEKAARYRDIIKEIKESGEYKEIFD